MDAIEQRWREKYYDKVEELKRSEERLAEAVNLIRRLVKYLDPVGHGGLDALEDSKRWLSKL